MKGLDKFLPDAGYTSKIVSEMSLGELCSNFIDRDIPVILWATMDMKKPYISRTWVCDGVEINWIAPEHCLLLVGYDDNHYIFNDPLKYTALTYYSKEAVEVAYNGLLKQAIVIDDPTLTLPDFSDEYRRSRAEDFFTSLNLNLTSKLEYGVEYESELSYFAIRYSYYKNETLETNPDCSWGSYNISNGTLTLIEEEKINTVYNQLSAEVTSNISFNSFSIAANFVKKISDGTVKCGIELNSKGEVITHLIVKEILRKSGPVTYTQTYKLEIIFRGCSTQSPEAEPAFNLEEYFNSIEIKDEIIVGGIVILGVAVAGWLVFTYGGVAGLVAVGKSWIGTEGMRQILLGFSAL